MSKKETSKELFHITTIYDEVVITKMCETQQVTFGLYRRFVLFLFAFSLIIAAITVCRSTVSAAVCIVLGCFCITGRNFSAMMRAASISRRLNKKFPAVRYCFTETGISSDQQKGELPYSKLIRLVEDKDFFYLYPSNTTTYMIKKAQLGSSDEFKAHIERSSSLTFTKPLSLNNFHIWAISAVLKANKAAKTRAAQLNNRQ